MPTKNMTQQRKLPQAPSPREAARMVQHDEINVNIDGQNVVVMRRPNQDNTLGMLVPLQCENHNPNIGSTVIADPTVMVYGTPVIDGAVELRGPGIILIRDNVRIKVPHGSKEKLTLSNPNEGTVLIIDKNVNIECTGEFKLKGSISVDLFRHVHRPSKTSARGPDLSRLER